MIRYKKEIDYYLNEISSYILMGALCGVAVLLGVALISEVPLSTLGIYEYVTAIVGGVLIGVFLKTIMVFAVEMVIRANAASAHLNAKRAQMLGERLKIESKAKVQMSVIAHAKEIIFQMNGEQGAVQLEQFFSEKMQVMTEEAFFKMDRHLSYLTDRAVHGDIKALKRLYQLYRRSQQEREQEMNKLLDRMINHPREVAKLKDKIDTLYDQWKFRHCARSYVAD